LKSDGSISFWGSELPGGNSAPTDNGYTQIFSNDNAYAALKPDGSITVWGTSNGGSGGPTGSGRLLVSTIQFQALAAGTNLFGSDSADIIPAHDVLLYRLDTSVSPSLIQYGSSSLAILEADNGEGEVEDFFTRDGLQLLSNDDYLSDELEDTLDLQLGTTSD
jgi:hypothetical protein